MVAGARWAGADWVKIAMYRPEDMTLKSDAPEFQITEGLWSGRTLWELYEQTALPYEFIPELADLTKSLGMHFAASAFSPDAVLTAIEYGVEVLKIASFEIGYEPLVDAVAGSGLPFVVSTGTATLDEIDRLFVKYGDLDMALLKCCSQYPAPLDLINLATIPDMIDRFHVPVGLSDHTTGIVCPVVAVSLGATIIEKHLKIDEDGFDVAFSLNLSEFREMVQAIRSAEMAIGKVDYTPSTTHFKRREYQGRWVRKAN